MMHIVLIAEMFEELLFSNFRDSGIFADRFTTWSCYDCIASITAYLTKVCQDIMADLVS